MPIEVLAQPVWTVATALAFGLIVGSFLNVVIYRLPEGQSVVFPSSRCPACGAAIRAWDNVPVLSYLALRGRCRSCGVIISPRYPLIELLTGCVFAAVAWRFGAVWLAPLLMACAAGLIAAAVIDLDHQIIPDEISVGGLALGLVLVPIARTAGGEAYTAALGQSLLGALLGWGMLWSVGFAHARFSAVIGREYEHWPGDGEDYPTPASLDYWTWFPGMGLGDVKLLAMIGAFLGPWGVLSTMVAASCLGLLMGVGSALVTRSFKSPFGFGPAIAIGALLSMLIPDPFVRFG
jgi:leader peptidase (prepilin peptidase)/N-methyltransferase